MQMNRLQLAGYLGKDPETRSTQGGGHVTNFSLGTSEKWKDKAGQPKQKTEWHRVVAWDKTAEFVQKHLGKGTHVYLEGAVRTREWQPESGEKRWVTEVHVTPGSIVFLDKKSNGDESEQPPAGEFPDRNGEPPTALYFPEP